MSLVISQSQVRFLKRLGAKREEAIMLGDTRFDIGCSINAGVDSILVCWGRRGGNVPLGEIEPMYRISKPEELFEIIEG